jgi:hypothetical protein
MQRELVLQAISGACPTVDVTRPFAEDYAARIGADYVLWNAQADGGMRPHRSVLEAILFSKSALDVFAPRYRRVLWLDADVYVRPGAPSIFSEVTEGAFGLWCEEGRLNADATPPHPMYRHGHGNAGVMVWPREAAGMFARVVEYCTARRGEMRPEERARMIWDQTPTNRVIEESGLPVMPLSILWNHHQTQGRVKRFGLAPVEAAWMVHFAGGHHLEQCRATGCEKVSQEVRAAQMREWIRRFG